MEGAPREIVTTLADGRPTWVRIGQASSIGGAEQTTREPDRVGLIFFVFGAYSRPGLESISVVIYAAISATASTYLAVRHGLLALVTFQFLQQTSLLTIFTLDPTDWYYAPTAIFLALIVAMTVFGIKTSTDRKLLPSRS